MVRPRNRAALAFILFTLVSACNPGLGLPAGGHPDIQEALGRDEYLFELVESTNTFALELNIQAKEGTFAWKVLDPDGETTWQGQVTGEDFIEVKDLPMKVGTWTLVVFLEYATGSYTYEWHTN